METLKKGSKGDSVKTLQSKLNLAVDGIFGNVTEEAVRQFQLTHGLVADGIVGNKTWEDLNKSTVTRKVNKIIVHCTATPEGKAFDVYTIDKWHRQRGFNCIGYHWVVYIDGTIARGREENIVGAHCEGQNTGSIGIAYVGGVASDGKTPKDTRTEAQTASLVSKIKQLMAKYNISKENVYGHYQFANKACPSFKIEELRKLL